MKLITGQFAVGGGFWKFKDSLCCAAAFIVGTDLVPGAVSPAMAGRVKIYRSDRLVVVNPQTREFTSLGGIFYKQ